MAMHPARLACRIATAICVVFLLDGCGGPLKMLGAPISTAGSVYSSAATRRNVDGSTETSLQEGLGISASSYIWQPWFATVTGDASIAYEKSFGDQNGSSVVGSGELALSILPQSKYPVTLGFLHVDSRASGELGAVDSIRDRASISAGAVLTQTLRAGFSADWTRSDQKDSGVDTGQSVNFDISKTFSKDDAFLGINLISLSTNLQNSKFVAKAPDEEDRDRQTAVVRLNIRSEPFEDVTYNSLFTATYDDLDEESETFQRMSLQGVSTVQWRPEEKPFVVTGSWRTLTEKIERNELGISSDTETLLAAASAGLRWPINDRFTFNVGAQASYDDTRRDEGGALGESAGETGTRISGDLSASANYFSEPRDLYGFDWRWDARASTRNGYQSDDGLMSTETIGLGHRFERKFEDLIFIPFSFAFDQDANVSFRTNDDDPITAGLNNSLTFRYSDFKNGTSTSAQLSLRDIRNLIGEERALQVLQAQVNRRVSLDRQRRLSGDLSAQITRSSGEGDTDISSSASGTFSYTHANLFDVERLGFRSELRINVVNFDELFGESSDRLDSDFLRNDWRNILTYNIGRLSAELEATGFHRDEGLGYLAIFRIRRNFGGGG